MRRLAALVLLAACGDDLPAPVDDGTGPPGDYDEPSDFPRQGCQPGSIVGLDLSGIWQLDIVFPGGHREVGALRLDEGPEGTEGLLLGQPAAVRKEDGDLLVRRVEEGGEVTALHACAVAADGTLAGHLGRCRGGTCQTAAATLHPLRPRDEPASVGLTAIATFGGGAVRWPVDARSMSVNVRHHGTTAYVVRYHDGLRIVDLADPGAPVELGHVPVARGDELWNDVKIVAVGDHVFALVASNLRGAVVLDVTDPTLPFEWTRFPAGGVHNVHTLAIEDGRAYLADLGIGGLRVFDVGDPRAPFELGAYLEPGAGVVHDLFVDGRVAYLCYWSLGMVAVDAGEIPLEAPAPIGRYDAYEPRASHSVWRTVAGHRPLVLLGDEGFGAHLRVLDGTRGDDFLTLLSEFRTRPEVSIHNVMAIGDLALIAYYQDGLRLVDLVDPARPVEIAHVHTWLAPSSEHLYGRSFYEGAIGVDVDRERGLILVADSHLGLVVIEPDEAISARVSGM